MFSKLAYQYVPMTPTHRYRRTRDISAVVIHYTASIVTEAKNVVNYWENSNPYTSSNYIIDVYGRITAVVPEEYRAYTSSSWGLGERDIDDRAITLECSCDRVEPYTVSEDTINAIVNLLADIGLRYDIIWNFTGNESGNIHAHKWYYPTPCPGEYLYGRFPDIMVKANNLMASKIKEKDSMTDAEKKQLNDCTDEINRHIVVKYNSLNDIPEWGYNEIKWLLDNGILKGTDNGLQLSYDQMRSDVLLARSMMLMVDLINGTKQ